MDNANEPKPVHQTNWMVIILLIIICAVVALGIWWWTQDSAKIADLERQVSQMEIKPTATPTPTTTVTPTATTTVTPTPTATADAYAGWKTYTNAKLKIEFKYPADWKGIEEEARECDNPAAATRSDPCEHINLLVTAFKDLQAYMAGPSIASAKSVLYEKYPVGRGGYWGDEVNKITDLNSVKNYCAKIGSTKCRVYQNANNVTIARSVEPNCSEAGCNGEIVMYYVKLNNDIFPAMVFSTAALKDTGTVDLDGKMDKLVDSLKFI